MIGLSEPKDFQRDQAPLSHRPDGVSVIPTELMACPGCAGILRTVAESLLCAGCKTSYPVLGGIPVLFKEPRAALAAWREILSSDLRDADVEIENLLQQSRMRGLLPATRRRLRLLRCGRSKNRRTQERLLAPLWRTPPSPHETKARALWMVPMGAVAPYLFRDWAWGARERGDILRAVLRLLPRRRPIRSLLVLGAGACRLPYELHMRLSPAKTVAVDLNLGLLLAASRLLRGRSLTLYEFPRNPRKLTSSAMSRICRAPGPVPRGLSLVAGDAAAPPLRPGSFDVVVTPFVIDVIQKDFRTLVPTFNRLLKPDGLWVNVGPLGFNHSQAARCYSREEALDALRLGGFDVLDQTPTRCTLLASPDSCWEQAFDLLCFCARKRREVPVPQQLPPRRGASWLQNPGLPIAALVEKLSLLRETAFMGPATGPVRTLLRDNRADPPREYRVTGAILELLSLVDGERSLQEIARVLSRRHGLFVETLQPQLTRHLEELDRKGLFSRSAGAKSGAAQA